MDTPAETLLAAFHGAFAADALAMPVHWYYDRAALRRDYGELDRFVAPRSPHPDSILWRSHYSPRNARGDILREQASYWGRRGVHYHQFLAAGENTLNFRLASELFAYTKAIGRHDPDGWLEQYVRCMLTPGWHRDTYVEECHRGFFTRYAEGKPLRKCGPRDEHIGGLAQVPALLAALGPGEEKALRATVQVHVALTHDHPGVLRAADGLTRLLLAVAAGQSLREALKTEAGSVGFSTRQAERWASLPDEVVVGQKLSPACYIDQAFPAALHLAWRHAEDFSAGIIANAMVGGDNCHRGAVVGALLGAALGVPAKWRTGALGEER